MIDRQKAVRALGALIEQYPEREEWVPLAQALGLYPYEAWDVVTARVSRGGERKKIVRMPEIVERDENGEVPYAPDLLPRVMGKVC